MAEPKDDVRQRMRFPGTQRSVMPQVRTLGKHWAPQDDLYHFILTRPWWQFFLLVAGVFVGLNLAFAVVYALAPGAVSGAREGSLEDAFFFSVQTMATIGYGTMAPVTRFAHVMVTFEALVGILSVALVTGITFAKFARPSARVLFCEKAVIAPRDGVPHLMVRMANWRQNQILEAHLRVILLIDEVSLEGQQIRRPMELSLVRERTATFMLSWTAMHRIDDKSPFFGEGAFDRLRAIKAEMYLTLSGLDETSAQTVHARYRYTLDDIVPNAHFADVLTISEGMRQIDYRQFHTVIPIEPAGGATAEPAGGTTAEPASEATAEPAGETTAPAAG